jgi:hypothetical protein
LIFLTQNFNLLWFIVCIGDGVVYRKVLSGFFSVVLLLVSLFSLVGLVQGIDFFLSLETFPADVLVVDSLAVVGEGYYASGTCVVVDAKPTVASEGVIYEFVEWSSYDPWVGDPDEEPVLTDTQAFIFMDSDRTVTAIYEPNYFYYLNLETDPADVLVLDPEAVVGEGYYASGTCVIVDAKPTVASEGVVYEFVEWSSYDDWPWYPDEEPELTETQAFIFMDADRTVTAIYEANYLFYLNLETDPSDVLVADPQALSGEGYYPSGTCVIVDAKPSVTSGSVVYEFVEWSSYDDWPFYPDEEPELTETQAFAFMDSDRTVTAIYEASFVGDWEFAYADESGDLGLTVSTDDKIFRFTAGDKDFGIKEANRMIVGSNTVFVSHFDNEISVVLFSINSIDYCVAYVRDMQTGQRYLLIDKIGVE